MKNKMNRASKTTKILWSLVAAFLIISGCSGPRVSRVDSAQVTDLSGRWNDTDSRLTAKEMSRKILNAPWLKDFPRTSSAKPTLIMGKITNRSHEHISTHTFVKDLESELLRSGKLDLVASKTLRKNIREERVDYQRKNSDIAGTRIIYEKPADFMLTGSIHTIQDQLTNSKVVFYQVNMELIDIKTNAKVWIGQKKLKKIITRPKVSW